MAGVEIKMQEVKEKDEETGYRNKIPWLVCSINYTLVLILMYFATSLPHYIVGGYNTVQEYTSVLFQ